MNSEVETTEKNSSFDLDIPDTSKKKEGDHQKKKSETVFDTSQKMWTVFKRPHAVPKAARSSAFDSLRTDQALPLELVGRGAS
jgi:hypothetical protein